MAKVRFQPNRKGATALLKSAEVQRMLQRTGDAVALRAGDGFGNQVNVGTRARATVMTETAKAKRSQAKNHDLERAIGGGI